MSEENALNAAAKILEWLRNNGWEPGTLNEYSLADIIKTEMESPWQPIETAPRDRTKVWLYNADYSPANFEGYYSGTLACWMYAGEIVHPTHWMPLPEPPKQKE